MSTRLRASGVSAALVAVGLLVAFVSALLAGGARSASQPQGLIAFTRDDGIYVMRPDGSNVRLLWREGALDVAWSPDGSKLAVSRGRSVWVVNVDGSDPVRMARVGASSLSWSPDGRRIAFTRWYHADNPDVWIMNADGSGMHRLKRTPKGWDSNVDWKPTGGWLAFDSGGYVPYVYVMRTNGSSLHRVTPQPVSGEQPDWSPDGRRIVFVNWDHEIWVMNANGRSQTRLTSQAGEAHPAWSPDGRKIAFSRGGLMSAASGVWVMNADGTSEKRLTAGANPAWQPVARRAPQATNKS